MGIRKVLCPMSTLFAGCQSYQCLKVVQNMTYITGMEYLMIQIIINASVIIMIEANRIIFPSPKLQGTSANYLNLLKENLVYMPKRSYPPAGCLCDGIVGSKNVDPSSQSTARTPRQQTTTQTIKIQSSRELQLKVMRARHRRSDTKIVSILSARSTNVDENQQGPINSIPNVVIRQQKKHFASKVTNIYIKNRGKFLSDQLYREQNHEQFNINQQIQTVRIAKKITKEPIVYDGLTSKFTQYRKSHGGSEVPCLFFDSGRNHDKLLVYFHGNGEDLTGCNNFLRNLSRYTQTSILAIQYPGYSFYTGNPSSQAIQSDSEEVIEFLRDEIGFSLNSLLIIGRSIGSGPAVHVASLYQIGGLILLSPFLSLCEVVQDLYGQVASGLLKQRFNNKQRAKEVSSPCLIVHGSKDKLISQKHSTKLSQFFRGFCTIKIVKEMSHSVFSHQEFFRMVGNFQSVIGFLQ